MATGADCVGRTLAGMVRGTNFSITGITPGATGLVKQFELEFKRTITRIYDLASPDFYYVEGASQGSITLQNVIGPKGAPKLDCTCVPVDLLLNCGPMMCPTGAQPPISANASNFTYTLKNALPAALHGQGDSETFLIVFSITYLFNDIV
jgi:hypothetical protein